MIRRITEKLTLSVNIELHRRKSYKIGCWVKLDLRYCEGLLLYGLTNLDAERSQTFETSSFRMEQAVSLTNRPPLAVYCSPAVH